MPVYRYRCKNCNTDFEVKQSINSKPHAKCPVCKKMTYHRLIVAIGGIVFKGSWPGKDITRREQDTANEI